MTALTAANQLTLLRMLLIPVLALLVLYDSMGWALIVLIVAALTDAFDGLLARRAGQHTALGAWLDPVADKLLLTSAFVTLTWLKVIPFWIAAVVVSRDLVLSVGVLVIHVAGGTVHPAPSWLGKLSTVCQMATVLAAMVTFYFGILPRMPKVFAWVTAGFTVASGLQYIVQGLKQINPPTAPAAGRSTP